MSLMLGALLAFTSAPSVVYHFPVGDEPSIGPSDALVTLVVVSEFQCPYCKRVQGTLKKLLESPMGPDLRIVFFHNPLGFHADAMPAALAAEAARMQGQFWPMHDRLFEHQGALGAELYLRLAAELKLDIGRFQADMESPALKERIEAQQRQAVSRGARGTPGFFINGRKMSGAQPYERFETAVKEALGRALVDLHYGGKREGIYDRLIAAGAREEVRAEAPRRRPPPEPEGPVEIRAREGAMALGAETPQVTIVAFSDFQCPFCVRGAQVMEQVLKAYPDQVQLVFRHLPLSFHVHADLAARAAEAAGVQGLFWPMHDLLFEHSRQLDPDLIEALAGRIPGLDVAQWRMDVKSPAIRAAVDADKAEAARIGARGTPNFFLNGHKIAGARPFEDFKAKIDELLPR